MSVLNDVETPRPFSRKSRYILVIESNIQELFTTAMLLHRFSYPVCTARNARQALDMISVAMPALVVTDLALPGMTGLEFLRVLGRNSHTYSIPVILLLPKDDETCEDEDFEIGSHLCLRRPVTVEDLFRAVQSVMETTPRSNLRIKTSLPVTINKTPLDSARGECATHLSSQGMYIRTFKYHAPNEKLALQIVIGARTINADATVIYTRRQDSRAFSEPGMAVKFIRIMAEDRDAIKQYIHDQVTSGIVTEVPRS
ncbi:MAG: response regulator [Nitrospirota bacterium]|nr:response regulator [Nitrospirota bacterium]